MPDRDEVEAVARVLYEARIGNGLNYYEWEDSWEEHEDNRKQYFTMAKAVIQHLDAHRSQDGR